MVNELECRAELAEQITSMSLCVRIVVLRNVTQQVRTALIDKRNGARFTKYLKTILRLSYDNAKVTIDLRRTSNLQDILR